MQRMGQRERRRFEWLRIAMWLAIGVLLIAPLVAMSFTTEVSWTPGDFVAAGALLSAMGLACELVARSRLKFTYKVLSSIGVVLLAATLWAQGAVGVF